MADWLSSFASGVSPRMEGGARLARSAAIAAAYGAMLGCGSAPAPRVSVPDPQAALDRAVALRPDTPALVAIARAGEGLLVRSVSGGPPTNTCARVGLLATALLQERLAQAEVPPNTPLGEIIPGVGDPLGGMVLSDLASHRTPLPSFLGAVTFEASSLESVRETVLAALPDDGPLDGSPEPSVANLYWLERALEARGSASDPSRCSEGLAPETGARAALPSPLASAADIVVAISRDETPPLFGVWESAGDEPLWTASHEEPGARAFAARFSKDGTALLVLTQSEQVDPEPLARELLAQLRGLQAARVSAPPADRAPADPESWRGRWAWIDEDAVRAEQELPPALRACLAELTIEPVGQQLELEPKCLGPLVLSPTFDSTAGFANAREGVELGLSGGRATLRVGAFIGRLRRLGR
jgi:hypothetical protein